MTLPEELARLGIPLDPDALRAGSGGEVQKPELLDWSSTFHATDELIPEPGGLFCSTIFGKDGTRFGHVELAEPVTVDSLEITCVPVLPPEARKIVRLDSTRLGISLWNDLYRKVVNRNNRLRKLLEISTVPPDILRREKDLLAETVRNLWAGPDPV